MREVKEVMLESQEILLQLVKELDDICKRNNITYYLIGGSALGAVRHHGFLPWDDDADIVMDHENYMRFVEVMKNPANLPPNRAYEDPFIEPYTQVNVFGRYSAVDTTCIFDVLNYYPSVHGIKVDVFHLIPCPDEGEERDAFLEKFRCWGELVHPIARNRQMNAELYRSLLSQMDCVGVGRLRKKLFDELHIEDYKDSSQYLYVYERDHIFYNKDVFGAPKFFTFEDCKLPVPTKYTEHFRILFGDDWFLIPDADGQIMHHVAQDTKRSYKEYTVDYLKYESSNMLEFHRELKYFTFKVWEKQRDIADHQTVLRKKLTELKAEMLWEREKDIIVEALENKDYALVFELLDPYLSEQFNAYSDRWEMFLEVNKELFVTALKAFLYTSQNKKARKLLLMAPDDYIDDEIMKYKELLACKDGLIKMSEEGETSSNMLQVVEKALLLHSNDRDLLLTQVKLLVNIDAIGNQSVIEKICADFPEDGEFNAVKARLCELTGRLKRAKELYEEALLQTKNGMVIMECNESIKSVDMEM